MLILNSSAVAQYMARPVSKQNRKALACSAWSVTWCKL